MKICIIGPVVIPILGKEQKYGGIETVISIAEEEMVKRGHDVYVFASGDSKVTSKLVATTPEALGQGVSFAKEKECNRIAYEMALAERPDVIWDNTLSVYAQEMRENQSKFLFKADIVLHPNELIDTGDIPVVQTWHGPAKDHLPKLIRDLSEAGQYFVSISKDQARRYLECFDIKNHLGTVYNAVNTDFYSVNYNKKGDYLLWVGRFCMEKGPHIAIEVAHKVGVPIKLIGKKAEKHEIDYYDKFIAPILGSDDEYLGMSTLEEKAKLMRNAKAVMMTNLWAEPFGLVVAEAMASGTPVVGPALGSLTEMIDQTGVLIPVDDLGLNENDTEVTESQRNYIDRIAKSMKKLNNIPPQVPRKRAEFLFSPRHNVDGYEEAFSKAMFLKESERKGLIQA
ncbi:MAG: glycosyltransferase [Patescibacteria group bacterium]|jgi:glycosyltransferase involved in cell wall biosynthesis|nr:glycosyltransferase [Patescibacteria group bacterium]